MPRTVRQQSSRQLSLVITSIDAFPRRQFHGYDLYFVLTYLGNTEEPVYSDFHSPKELDFSDELFTLDLSACSQNGIAELALFCTKNDRDIKLATTHIPLNALEYNKHNRLGFKLWLLEGAPLSVQPVVRIRFVYSDGRAKVSSLLKKKPESVSKQTEKVFLSYRTKVTDEEGYLIESEAKSTEYVFSEEDANTVDSIATSDENSEHQQKLNRLTKTMMAVVEPKNWSVLYDPEFIKFGISVIVEETGGILKQPPAVRKYLRGVKGSGRAAAALEQADEKREELVKSDVEITLKTLPELPENPPPFVPRKSLPPLYAADFSSAAFTPAVAPVFVPDLNTSHHTNGYQQHEFS